MVIKHRTLTKKHNALVYFLRTICYHMIPRTCLKENEIKSLKGPKCEHLEILQTGAYSCFLYASLVNPCNCDASTFSKQTYHFSLTYLSSSSCAVQQCCCQCFNKGLQAKNVPPPALDKPLLLTEGQSTCFPFLNKSYFS